MKKIIPYMFADFSNSNTINFSFTDVLIDELLDGFLEEFNNVWGRPMGNGRKIVSAWIQINLKEFLSQNSFNFTNASPETIAGKYCERLFDTSHPSHPTKTRGKWTALDLDITQACSALENTLKDLPDLIHMHTFWQQLLGDINQTMDYENLPTKVEILLSGIGLSAMDFHNVISLKLVLKILDYLKSTNMNIEIKNIDYFSIAHFLNFNFTCKNLPKDRPKSKKGENWQSYKEKHINAFKLPKWYLNSQIKFMETNCNNQTSFAYKIVKTIMSLNFMFASKKSRML